MALALGQRERDTFVGAVETARRVPDAAVEALSALEAWLLVWDAVVQHPPPSDHHCAAGVELGGWPHCGTLPAVQQFGGAAGACDAAHECGRAADGGCGAGAA